MHKSPEHEIYPVYVKMTTIVGILTFISRIITTSERLLPCGHLLGGGWPLGSCLWCLVVKLSLSHWYPESGVVLDCIDSWSLPSFLLKARNFFICEYFSFYGQLKFCAQLSWAWKKFYHLEAWSSSVEGKTQGQNKMLVNIIFICMVLP